jgi:hypothetical protein
MLRWFSGIRLWMFCFRVATITRLRYLGKCLITMLIVLFPSRMRLDGRSYDAMQCCSQVWADDDDDWQCVQTLGEPNKYATLNP